MHKLQRDPVQPACLGRYQHGQDTWSMQSPTDPERGDIWMKLGAMQRQCCAYCEAPLEEGARHIEHFRQRSRHPQGTFSWDNLFGSCNRQGTCGNHKDQCGIYLHTDLVKPDAEDPEDFLVFLPNGSVRPRANLSPADFHRATETIRVLNLDGVLRQIRYSEVIGYAQTAETFAELASQFDESEWLPLLQDELNQTAHLPYATAIKHVLTRHSVAT